MVVSVRVRKVRLGRMLHVSGCLSNSDGRVLTDQKESREAVYSGLEGLGRGIA